MTAEKAVSVSGQEIREWQQDWELPDNSSTEFDLLVYKASDALLQHDACVIHAAALFFEGRAWLFAAESGIGKSTQLKNWMSLYQKDVRIINGDKPILRFMEDGKIYVYPSPWRGKENWGDDEIVAPLGGVILLKQGAENQLAAADLFQQAARLFSCFFSWFEEEESVRRICLFEERIWNSVPVWVLTNTGDVESAKLVHDLIKKRDGDASAAE